MKKPTFVQWNNALLAVVTVVCVGLAAMMIGAALATSSVLQ